MEKLANERVVEPRLPFLYKSKFKTTIVSSFDKKGNWCPYIQVGLLLPESNGKFCLDKLVMGELATILAIQSMMHGRPNIKLGLHVHNVGETKINTLGPEKWLGKEIVCRECQSPKMCEIGAPFQN